MSKIYISYNLMILRISPLGGDKGSYIRDVAGGEYGLSIIRKSRPSLEPFMGPHNGMIKDTITNFPHVIF